MARVDVLAYSPTEVLEESDVTVGRARELTEKFPVAWVNILDLDPRTLEELETLFGLHPLALEDSARPDYLCYTILDVLVDSYFPHLDRLEGIIQDIEREMIEAQADVKIEKIHAIRTDLLLLRNALRPQRDAFTTITRLELPYFKKETRNYLRDAYDHMIRTLDPLDTYREIVTSRTSAQTTMVSNQINQVIKLLTIIFTVP